MWQPAGKRELRYMRRMEERVWKRRMLDGLAWTAFLLIIVLALTYSSRLKEEERMADTYIGDYIVEGFVDVLANRDNPDYKTEAGKARGEMEAARRRLKTTYVWIYGLECLLAAGIYISYGHSSLQKLREILGGPLLAQHAVCTGKREYHSRSTVSIYINIKTESNEKLSDIRVPYLIGSKIECEMPVLAVKYTQAGDDRENVPQYKIYPGRTRREQHVERCQ